MLRHKYKRTFCSRKRLSRYKYGLKRYKYVAFPPESVAKT